MSRGLAFKGATRLRMRQLTVVDAYELTEHGAFTQAGYAVIDGDGNELAVHATYAAAVRAIIRLGETGDAPPIRGEGEPT